MLTFMNVNARSVGEREKGNAGSGAAAAVGGGGSSAGGRHHHGPHQSHQATHGVGKWAVITLTIRPAAAAAGGVSIRIFTSTDEERSLVNCTTTLAETYSVRRALGDTDERSMRLF